jgi:hypothetical protein
MLENDPETIRIWQQNTRKSLTVQLATLHSVEDKYDIICIQEPHLDFQAMSRATSVWTSVYPTGFKHDKEGTPPRALTLVHTRLSTNNWTQVPVNSLDIVAIWLTCERGRLNIYNIYCKGTPDLGRSLMLQQRPVPAAFHSYSRRRNRRFPTGLGIYQ